MLPSDKVVWHLLLMKFPHAEWCELMTGLWDECDCGANDKRGKLYERYLNKLYRNKKRARLQP